MRGCKIKYLDNEIEKINGDMPNKQLKMLLGWAAMHQEELQENWYLARQRQSKFQKAFLDEFGNVAWDIDETADSSVHWNNRIDLCKDALYLDSI